MPRSKVSLRFALLYLTPLGVNGADNLVYEMVNRYDTNELMTFDVTSRCADFFGYDNVDDIDPTSKEWCVFFEPVLQPLLDQGGHGLHMAMERAQTELGTGGHHDVCVHQHQVCDATERFMHLTDDCSDMLTNCRVALRHLHHMMFVKPPSKDGNYNHNEQICNNFSRKSIRGFFHDYMSNGIDGSILDEHSVHMNFGLCRWSQYINVLSDYSKCDPGSIIAMAGELGYLACGVDLYNVDIAVKPLVTVNRPYPCASNIDSSPLFHAKQRKEQFSDAQLASNSTAMEEFWYEANKHAFGRPDGEIEYSGEAAAAGHAIGRVTCPPDGKTNSGSRPDYKLGFFNKPPSSTDLEAEYGDLWWAVNTTNVNRQYQHGIDRLHKTQCLDGSVPQPQPEGVRPSTDEDPILDGETDFNSEGGLCGMPTQFLGSVRVGGLHRVPRWVSIFEHSSPAWPPFSEYQSSCRTSIKMYIPTELLTLSTIPLPTSEALDRFADIAWDGYDRIDSEWDSCLSGCSIPIATNTLCGGSGIQDFDWETPSDCKEYMDSKFVKTLKYDADGNVKKAIKKSCSWLQDQVNPQKHCKKDLQHGVFKSAAETCPVTCTTCTPPTNPPSSPCNESPKTKFVKFVKYNPDGTVKRIAYKTCKWLSKQDDTSKFCSKDFEYEGVGSANVECPITCERCL